MRTPQLQLNGARFGSKADIIVLKGTPDNVNSFEDPSKIVPVVNTIDIKVKTLRLELAPYSLTVLKFKTR
jgi:alpha-L-arabinofuranosidase